ncbi:MAG TPA: hypothetical protein VLS93_05835, partial [Anaeromyxobacteraceae bacterium]|nr:hypothetical protein [Anaeromyxobacteraceae bacterium]
MPRPRLALAALVSLVACAPAEEPSTGPTRHPGVTVTGSVADVRGGPAADAQVLVWNSFDTGSATTGADGSFSLVMDGSSEASSWRVTHGAYRPRSGSIAVGAAGADAGSIAVVSKEEIVFSGQGANGYDLFMVRADGAGGVLQLTDTTGVDELTPRRDASGLTLRWADTAADRVMEAA